MFLLGVVILSVPLVSVCAAAITATQPPVAFDAESHRLVFDRASLSLALGGEGSAALMAALAPTLSEEAEVIFHWSTADPEIAMVSDTGAAATVTALQGGVTRLIAKASIPAWEVEWLAECVVWVHEPVRSINLSTGLLALRANDADRAFATLAYAIQPATHTEVITWRVEQDGGEGDVIAFDTQSGLVRALREGTAYVVAEASSGVSARCRVVVEPAGEELPRPRSAVAGVSDEDVPPEDAQDTTPAQSISFAGLDTAIGIRLGDPPVVLLDSLVFAGEAPLKEQLAQLTWRSSDRRIARVDEGGAVYPVKVGKATITVRSSDGRQASSLVTVYRRDALSARLHAKSTVRLTLGRTLRPTVVFAPMHSYAELRWTSSDPTVAFVDPGSGLITAVGKGTAQITAQALNGSIPNLSLAVIVSAPITSLVIETDASARAIPGQIWTLTVMPEPPWDITSDTVTWSSSNPKVASVDRHTGVVIAHRAGATVIIARATSGVRATYPVRVDNPIKITESKTEWTEWPSAKIDR